MHVNKVIMIGPLGHDAEFRYMPSRIEVGLARVISARDASKSRTPENILASASASASDGMDAAADSSGVEGGDGGGANGGSGDGDDDSDGDPDSDRRRSPTPIPPDSKRKTKAPLARSGKSRKRRDPQSSSTLSDPRSPDSVPMERRRKRVHWMAFALTLAAMWVALWCVERGYDPAAASAFVGAFALCIQTLLKT